VISAVGGMQNVDDTVTCMFVTTDGVLDWRLDFLTTLTTGNYT
jgi:hypothetical protein